MRFALEPSLVPHWVADRDHWRRQYAHHPLRLTLTCTREGDQPWILPIDIAIEPDPNGPQPDTEHST